VKNMDNTEKQQFLEGLSIEQIQLNLLEGSTEYFDICKKHTRRSFIFAVLASAFSLGLLVAAVVLAVLWEEIEIPIMAAIGALLANFIAATLFWVYRKCAEQLNRYHNTLHTIEVLLAGAKVIDEITDELERDKAYTKILDRLFDVQAIKAQNETKTKGK